MSRDVGEPEVDFFDIEAREEQRLRIEEETRQRENQAEADYIWLMSHHAGRRIVWEFLAPLWRISYSYERREHTEFLEGERNIALRTWARIQKACPHLARKLLEENAQ